MMAGGTAAPTIFVLGPRAQGRADLLTMLAAEGFRAVDAVPGDQDAVAPPTWNRAIEARFDTDPLARGVPPQRETVLVIDLGDDGGSDAGEAICRQVRSAAAAAGVPLLVVVDEHLAGAAGAGDRSQLLEAGADACLARPVDPGELAATVRALLRIRGDVFDLQRRTGELRLSLAERSEAVERWHALFSSSSAAIVTVDSEGLVQAWNPSAERMFGWKAQEVIGGPPPFIPPEGEPEYQRTLAALADGNEISSIETVRMHRNGTRVPVALSRAAIFDEHGRHRGSIATVVDVTQASADRDRAAQLGALLTTLVDRAPIGLAFLDTDLRFQRVNQELADLDGLATEAHAGRHVGDVLARSASTLVPLLHEVMRSRTPCLDVELSVVVPVTSGAAAAGGERSDEPGERNSTIAANPSTDEARAWLASLYPVETTDGVLLGAGLIIHDVTERRRIDAERARLFQAEHAARHRATAADGAGRGCRRFQPQRSGPSPDRPWPAGPRRGRRRARGDRAA